MPDHSSRTRVDFQQISKARWQANSPISPTGICPARSRRSESRASIETPSYNSTEKGISDFAGGARPATENICPNFFAGLMRSAFGTNASAEKTKPPCARLLQRASNQTSVRGAMIQRTAATPVQVSAGIALLKSARAANSGQLRHETRQRCNSAAETHSSTSTPAKLTSAPLSSRLRATRPFSRAFCRRRGVACSVLSSCAMSLSARQMHQAFCPVNCSGEVTFEDDRPVLQRKRQNRKADHALDRQPKEKHGQLRRGLAQKSQDHISEKRRQQRRSRDLHARQPDATGSV